MDFHIDLDFLKQDYAQDKDFSNIVSLHESGQTLCLNFSFNDGYLFFTRHLCINQNLRKNIMAKCHLPPFIGHRGINATIQAIEKDFYWPRMCKDIATFIQECNICQ